MQLLRTSKFESWLTVQSAKIQALIAARIYRITNYDHFGDAKYLGHGLAELRWKNGLRVYFVKIGKREILLLNAGEKSDQKNDIRKARILIEQNTSSQT